MEIDSQTAERVLNNLLAVCLYSGSRNMGIAKMMDENREFLNILLGKDGLDSRRPAPCECFPWMEIITQKNDLFFTSLIAALQPTFPDGGVQPWFTIRPWRGRYHEDEIMWSEAWVKRHQKKYAGQASLEDCYYRVMFVSNRWLAARLDDNRYLAEFLFRYPEALAAVWVRSWLEEFDFFFMDCWAALEMDEFYRDQPERRPYFRPWPEIYPGGRQEHEQSWLRLKARQDAEAQHNTVQDRQEEKPRPHEPAAR